MLVELPFEVATKRIAKTGAGCAGIGLQKAWEEAFYWDIIHSYWSLLLPQEGLRWLCPSKSGRTRQVQLLAQKTSHVLHN